MARNFDGEFEMVLGNKQLLSLFFLVAVLFAVFFSLGYMVGNSVTPMPTLAAEPPAPAETMPVSGRTQVLVTPSEAERPSPVPAEPAAAPQPTAVTETLAARTEPAPAAEPPPTEPKLPPAPLVARELHLQVAAVRVRDDADALADNLRRKGYTVTLYSQARDGWYRVVIGPFPNERSALEMKARLEKDGHKSILKKP